MVDHNCRGAVTVSVTLRSSKVVLAKKYINKSIPTGDGVYKTHCVCFGLVEVVKHQ